MCGRRTGQQQKEPAMSLALVLTAVLALFAVFAGALTYAQLAAHDIYAPGAQRA